MAPSRDLNLPTSAARRSNQAGFTLIEILVSGMVVSVMVFLAFFSMGLFLREWEHRRLGDLQAIREYRRQTLVRHALEGIWEYYVTNPLAERNNVYYPYFQGQRQGLAFVTTSPVFTHQATAAAEILFQPDPRDPSTGALIYREKPLHKGYIRYDDTPLEYPYALVLMPEVQKVQIRYYGLLEVQWDSATDELIEIRNWSPAFDGRERQAVAEIIEITTTTARGQEQVQTFSVRAHNRNKGWMFMEF